MPRRCSALQLLNRWKPRRWPAPCSCRTGGSRAGGQRSAAAEPEETAPVASAPQLPNRKPHRWPAPPAAEPEKPRRWPARSCRTGGNRAGGQRLQLLNRNTPHQQIETVMMKE
ncbi:hypothetical protein EAO22_30000 [Klebsiella pneumoniae]|nr:hypothetical protein EAO22_30000 [Klebsiella pneumoniae]